MPVVSNEMLIALLIGVVVVAAIIAWASSRRRRSEQLKEHFGPEYDRAVDEYGDEGRAEMVLRARQERAEDLHLLPVLPEKRDQLTRDWRSVEARFVDDPAGAVAAADDLIAEVMKARGFPEGDFERRVTDISSAYPHLAGDYRSVHEIAMRSRRGEASTEDLRRAMITYKSLFEGLFETGDNERRKAA